MIFSMCFSLMGKLHPALKFSKFKVVLDNQFLASSSHVVESLGHAHCNTKLVRRKVGLVHLEVIERNIGESAKGNL